MTKVIYRILTILVAVAALTLVATNLDKILESEILFFGGVLFGLTAALVALWPYVNE